ncbi:hypothetical protein ELH48_08210 [Rhizobium ruizarguesonis]|jgi:hypothetical protein|nr:hypothetical protein [Rhizobium leguminosarum]NEH64780.1 hypothetical protein [Rhizobium ruizarguesonis]QJS30413.1 hypothetical protein RLTA1_08190 [Rhizobium leguminosarum bv. trifolii TA1]MBY5860049.1 hypothetical protein [Rhizobium leguminosarum]MBY5874769.1 hypothetical protein [Rhizobium leguminosarum]
MRICVEAHWRFSEIFKVDREEAIDNVDRAFEMKLEAFHTLYDVSKDMFPYFDHADAALLIAVRNAIHHRNHPLFRTLNHRLHIEDGVDRWLGASFLLANHATRHGGEIRMSHYVRLDDLDARLDPSAASPHLDGFIKGGKAEKRFDLINKPLSLQIIRTRASQERYPVDQVYLDLMPIFVSAVCKVFKAMEKAGIGFKGFDALTYATPFTSELEVDLNHLDFKRLWLRGYGPLDLIPIQV